MKHGYAKRSEIHGPRPNIYRRWQHMIQRCNNPNDGDWARYGGKGVQVCRRWRHGENGKSGFECFLEDMGEPPSNLHSIDRKRVKGDYEPGNCRWATPKEQANNRSTTKFLTIDGECKPLSEWCEQHNIGPKTVLYRLKKGMSHKTAVTFPLQKRHKRSIQNGED